LADPGSSFGWSGSSFGHFGWTLFIFG
jgi:hypothetical protein